MEIPIFKIKKKKKIGIFFQNWEKRHINSIVNGAEIPDVIHKHSSNLTDFKFCSCVDAF